MTTPSSSGVTDNGSLPPGASAPPVPWATENWTSSENKDFEILLQLFPANIDKYELAREAFLQNTNLAQLNRIASFLWKQPFDIMIRQVVCSRILADKGLDYLRAYEGPEEELEDRVGKLWGTSSVTVRIAIINILFGEYDREGKKPSEDKEKFQLAQQEPIPSWRLETARIMAQEYREDTPPTP